MKFRAIVSKEWLEMGEVVVEADSKIEAEELVRDMLADGDEAIKWHSDGMEPGQEHIEEVKQVK